MTQLQVELVNPRAGRLLQELEAMNLIAIKKPEPVCDCAKVPSSAASDSLEQLPEGFHPMLVGKIPFSLYGRMKIVGDIMAPLDIEWEAMR